MDPLGDRMKGYESAYSLMMPEQMPAIIRIDGRAFHTATKNLSKPWDSRVHTAMQATALSLMGEVQNSCIAFTQSDEISILMINYTNPLSQSWFGGKVNKINSVAASIATKNFNDFMKTNAPEISGREWIFDARSFSLSREEVRRYFIWRQMDCRRNSVSAWARCFYSSKELHGKSVVDMIAMCKADGNDWETLSSHYKFGILMTKDSDGLITIHGTTPDFIRQGDVIEKIVNKDKQDEMRRILESSQEVVVS
jgi:tRNA(His) guanylyltransferase